MNLLCPSWSYCSNHLADPDGRIILIWKHPLTISIAHQSRQSMTCQVVCPTAPSFYFTAVYAGNTVEERSELWVELLDLHATLNLGSYPWLVGGDFNEIRHPTEHSAPSSAQITNPMIDFYSCLHQLEIQDLRYHGEKFTWSNKQPDTPIAKKLDRALINEHWLNSYPRSLALFLAPEILDHTPCYIEPDRPRPQAGTKPFKFFNYLTLHPDFLKLVAETWVLSLRHPNSANFSAERALLEKLQFLKKIEEEYYKQLSRINWLKCGDQNTSYFHKVAKARKAFNSIIILISISGIEVTSPEDIGNLAVAHFLNILGPPTPQTTPL
ncbi:uncharacterized protein LOC117134387 [Brassica rapa]|uniref:uncharacterized protein LOC106354877 n=1 Tax=Brassica napus TaxID=3708 RepID=UPI0006AB5AB2|nr:uncharacterized protein LOC106354877 [Brassica napus]XP_033148579.1 uncharacterized protein LOC117134387 [Brassica rapa]